VNLANSKVEEGGKILARCEKFEKRRIRSSTAGDRVDKGARNTDYSAFQFLVVIQKDDIENISRTKVRWLGETNGL
jgi:hypothetical protein